MYKRQHVDHANTNWKKSTFLIVQCGLHAAKIDEISFTAKYFEQKKRLEQEASNLEGDLEKL